MRKLLLSIVIAYLASFCYGQVIETINVDSVTGQFDKHIPFDEPFNIYFQGSTYANLRKVFVYRLLKHNVKEKTYKDGARLKTKRYKGYSLTKQDTIFVSLKPTPNRAYNLRNDSLLKQDTLLTRVYFFPDSGRLKFDSLITKYSLTAREKLRTRGYNREILLQSLAAKKVNDGKLVYYNPIKAKTSTLELLSYGINESQIKKLLDINESLLAGDEVSFKKAKQAYWDLYKNMRADLGSTNSGSNDRYIVHIDKIPFSPDNPLWFEYVKLFNDSLKQFYQIMQESPVYLIPDLLVKDTTISQILSLGSRHQVNVDLLIHLGKFKSPASYNKLLLGMLKIPHRPSPDTVLLEDVPERIKNLKKSISYLEQASDSVRLLWAKVFPLDSSEILLCYYQQLDTIHKQLIRTNKELEEASKAIRTLLTKDGRFTYFSWYEKHTDMIDLKTKGSYYVKPTFGFANVFIAGHDSLRYIPKLYLGASFYFYPLKHKLPFKYHTDKRFFTLKRLSINLAATIGETQKKDFKDSFSKISLLGGLNYDLLRELTISIGGCMLQQATGESSSTQYKYVVMPYVGIALNIDFANSISKLTGKIYQ